MNKPPLGQPPAFDVSDALNAALEALWACQDVVDSPIALSLCKLEAIKQLRIALASIEDGDPLPFIRHINGDGRFFAIDPVKK